MIFAVGMYPWETDPLLCMHYGGALKIISFIYERKMIKKILDHFGLYEEDKSNRNRALPVFPSWLSVPLVLSQGTNSLPS
jgi:hypothetical protein